MLAINGENDTQVVPEKNLAAIQSALDRGGNRRYELKAYPRLNHLFQERETGRVDEYGKIEQTISQEVLSDIHGLDKKRLNNKKWLQKIRFSPSCDSDRSHSGRLH